MWVSARRFSTSPETAANAGSPLDAGIAVLSHGSNPADPHRILAVSRGVPRRRSNALAEHPHASLRLRRGATEHGGTHILPIEPLLTAFGNSIASRTPPVSKPPHQTNGTRDVPRR